MHIIRLLHAECGGTFSFFNICLKPESWSIIQLYRESSPPNPAQCRQSCSRAISARMKMCEKGVEGVRSALFWSGSGWLLAERCWGARGVLIGGNRHDAQSQRWIIYLTSVETLKGTRTPSILEIPRVPKPRGQAEPSSCVILPSLWILCPVQSPGQTFGGVPLEGTFKIVVLKLSR